MAKGKKAAPLSEDQRKFHKEWTKEDCIAELKRIAEIDPDQVVTRNYFRVHSEISESTWNRYFGTFLEFKRQANIILSRHAHRLEKSIAKHASVSEFKKMNVDKAGWEGKYLKPNGKRFKVALTGSDIHDKDCDPFYRRLFIETARRVQPDIICIPGDLFDLPEFSKYTQDPREFDPVGRIKWVHAFLGELREASPDSEIHVVEGNHEFRLLRHLSEGTPALLPILSELHGLTISDILGLSKFEVNYIARSDLAAFTEKDIKKELSKNYFIAWNSVLFHHFPEGRDMGMPGFNGHHHRHFVWHMFNPTYQNFEWHQLGAGHRRQASYCPGEKWGNGFGLAHVDTERLSTQIEYFDVRDFCCIGGTYYTRQPDELLFASTSK